MPKLEDTAIHESAHAIIAMALGYVPEMVLVERSGGSVQFDEQPSDHSRLLIGMAGGVAEEMFLGIPFECSEGDCAFMADGWQQFMGMGIRWQQEQRISNAVFSLVATYETEIVCLANELLSRPRMDRQALGRFVRSKPELQQFRSLRF